MISRDLRTSPRRRRRDDLGIVPRHRFQVFERDRADAHCDALLFHESIASTYRPAGEVARQTMSQI